MSEEFKENNPFYQHLANEYNLLNSNEYASASVDSALNEMTQLNMVDYYNNHTDFEHKERLKKIDAQRSEFVTRIDDHINQNVPTPTPLKKPKEPKLELDPVTKAGQAVADPMTAGLKAASLLAETDIPLLKQYGQAAEMSVDFINGLKKSITGTVAAIPQLIEDGLAAANVESQTLNNFNDRTSEIIDASFRSSGKYTANIKGYDVDVPHLTGEILGHFALPAGVGAAVLKATKNSGMITKGASLLLSEAAVGAVTTDKESGTLLNMFYEKDEHERLYPMLRMLHIDEDDTAFEARMKGALEGVLPVGAIGAVKGIIETGKQASRGIRAVRDVAVIKQINKKPGLAVDFLYANKGADFNESKFKDFVFRDFKKDSYDNLIDATFKYLKDEEGAIFIGKKERMAGLVEKARNNLLKNIEEKELQLSKVEKNSPEAKQLRKEILAIKKNADDIGSFNKKFLADLKKGDFKDSTESLKQLSKKMPTLKTDAEMDIALKAFDDQVKFIDDLKRKDLTTYNKLKGIFSNKTLKEVSREDIENFDFLSAFNKEGGSYEDIAHAVSDPDFTSKEVSNILQTFYKTDDIKKYTDAELAKKAKDVIEVYGGNPEAVEKMSREGLLSFPEAVAADHLLVKNGFTELAAAADKLSAAKAKPGNKKELQVYLVNFLDKQAAFNKLVANMTQRRSDAGTSLRLQRTDVRSKIIQQTARKEFQDFNFNDPEIQAQFFEKILQADPGEVKRISSEISDIFTLVDNNKMSMNEALKEMAYRGAKSKLGNNLKIFFYNNMLSSFGTMAKNLVGLQFNKVTDDLTEVFSKMASKSEYYNAENFDTETFDKLLKVMDEIDVHEEATSEFLQNSKFLSGFYDQKTGKMKSKSKIFKDSFTIGKSILDPGGEKYGVGYKSLTDAERMALKSHTFTFGEKPSTDEIAMTFFKEQVLNDSNKIQQDFNVISPASIHSMPLRTLNAMDEAYKAKIVYEKMLLNAKRKLNSDILKLKNESPEAFSKYMSNLEKNYSKGIKQYLNDTSNFDEAMGEARNITLTKQYNSTTGEDYSLVGVGSPSSLMSAFQEMPVLNWFYPFARISINVADFLTQYLPLGLNRWNKGIADDLQAGGYRAAKATAKARVGLVFSGMAYGLARNNVITGNGPVDPYGKQQWRQLGIKERSINIGDISIPVDTIDPFGKYLVAVADLKDGLTRAFNDGNEELIEKAAPVMMNLGLALSEIAAPDVLKETILGIANATIALERGDYSKLSFQTGRFLSTATGKIVPFSSALRNFSRPEERMSYVEYEKDGLKFLDTAVKGVTSLFGSPGSVPEKNIFNDKVYYHSIPKEVLGEAVDQDYINRYAVSPMKKALKLTGLAKYQEKRQDPVYKKLRDLVLHLPEKSYKNRDLPLPRLSRTLRIQNESVTLDNKQYSDLIGYTNGYHPDGRKFMKPMKEYLNELVQTDKFNAYPEELQSELIKSIVREYHKAGRSMFKAMNKQFQNDAITKINESMGIE